MFSSFCLNLIIMSTYILKRTLFSFCQSKPLLYIFAGQGTQQLGMLSDLLKIPEATAQIQKFSETLSIDFPTLTQTNPKALNSTPITQPLLVLSQCLRYKYLHNLQLKPTDFMIGHSVGEYSALCVAGSIGLEECLGLVRKRGEFMEKFTREVSGMLIVRFGDQKKQAMENIIHQAGLQIACYNTPNNVNIAGPIQKLEIAKTKFKQARITCLFLPVSAAFHCQMLREMVQPFKQYISTITFKNPKSKILRNLDTKIYQQDSDIKQGLIQHLTHPVMFEQSVRCIDPSIQCIQIGHNQMIKKFVEETRKKMRSF